MFGRVLKIAAPFLGTRPNISESHSEISTRVPFCIVAGTLVGEPWASLSDHSNGVFAALNMIQEWEYGRNDSFLRRVARLEPFARPALCCAHS